MILQSNFVHCLDRDSETERKRHYESKYTLSNIVPISKSYHPWMEFLNAKLIILPTERDIKRRIILLWEEYVRRETTGEGFPSVAVASRDLVPSTVWRDVTRGRWKDDYAADEVPVFSGRVKDPNKNKKRKVKKKEGQSQKQRKVVNAEKEAEVEDPIVDLFSYNLYFFGEVQKRVSIDLVDDLMGESTSDHYLDRSRKVSPRVYEPPIAPCKLGAHPDHVLAMSLPMLQYRRRSFKDVIEDVNIKRLEKLSKYYLQLLECDTASGFRAIPIPDELEERPQDNNGKRNDHKRVFPLAADGSILALFDMLPIQIHEIETSLPPHQEGRSSTLASRNELTSSFGTTSDTTCDPAGEDRDEGDGIRKKKGKAKDLPHHDIPKEQRKKGPNSSDSPPQSPRCGYGQADTSKGSGSNTREGTRGGTRGKRPRAQMDKGKREASLKMDSVLSFEELMLTESWKKTVEGKANRPNWDTYDPTIYLPGNINLKDSLQMAMEAMNIEKGDPNSLRGGGAGTLPMLDLFGLPNAASTVQETKVKEEFNGSGRQSYQEKVLELNAEGRQVTRNVEAYPRTRPKFYGLTNEDRTELVKMVDGFDFKMDLHYRSIDDWMTIGKKIYGVANILKYDLCKEIHSRWTKDGPSKTLAWIRAAAMEGELDGQFQNLKVKLDIIKDCFRECDLKELVDELDPDESFRLKPEMLEGNT